MSYLDRKRGRDKQEFTKFEKRFFTWMFVLFLFIIGMALVSLGDAILRCVNFFPAGCFN